MYVALVALLLVDQPKNAYPLFVGAVLLIVKFIPVSVAGAPLPPFASYVKVYCDEFDSLIIYGSASVPEPPVTARPDFSLITGRTPNPRAISVI